MIKRLILTLAGVTVLAASPVAADLAFAKDKGGREDGRGRGQGRGRSDDGPRWERRGPPEGRGPEGRAYERRREYDGPPRAVRPGGRLPPEYRGAPVYDYPRHRLRPPPAGYAWRRMGDAFVLVDRDGRVFDIIPD